MYDLNNPKLAIIGAGVSGLSAAWALKDSDWEVSVFEKSRGPSGRAATRTINEESILFIPLTVVSYFAYWSEGTVVKLVLKLPGSKECFIPITAGGGIKSIEERERHPGKMRRMMQLLARCPRTKNSFMQLQTYKRSWKTFFND